MNGKGAKRLAQPIFIERIGTLAEQNPMQNAFARAVLVGGSSTLVRSQLREDLLDELKLVIHPVILGKGKRLFTVDLDMKRLQLVDLKVTGAGVVIVTYRPAAA